MWRSPVLLQVPGHLPGRTSLCPERRLRCCHFSRQCGPLTVVRRPPDGRWTTIGDRWTAIGDVRSAFSAAVTPGRLSSPVYSVKSSDGRICQTVSSARAAIQTAHEMSHRTRHRVNGRGGRESKSNRDTCGDTRANKGGGSCETCCDWAAIQRVTP